MRTRFRFKEESMNKKLKKLVSGTSVTLCALIAFSLPTQVFAQNLPINTEVKTQTPRL